jgi:hypothetical protein
VAPGNAAGENPKVTPGAPEDCLKPQKEKEDEIANSVRMGTSPWGSETQTAEAREGFCPTRASIAFSAV